MEATQNRGPTPETTGEGGSERRSEQTDPQAAALSLLRRMFFPEEGKQPLFFHALRRDVVLTLSASRPGEWAILHRSSGVAGGLLWHLEDAKGVEDLLANDVACFVDAVVAWSV